MQRNRYGAAEMLFYVPRSRDISAGRGSHLFARSVNPPELSFDPPIELALRAGVALTTTALWEGGCTSIPEREAVVELPTAEIRA